MEFEVQIKTMLQDTVKGLATKEELKTAVREAQVAEIARQDAESKKAIDPLTTAIKEMQDESAKMRVQLRRLIFTGNAELHGPDGTWKGIWGSQELARQFGLVVLAEIGGSVKAREELKSLGIQVEKASVSGSAITSGEALMPTEFMGHLQAMMGRYGLIRRFANIMPVGNSGIASIQDSDPVVYAPGAGTAPMASAPGFKSIGIQPKKMLTLVPIDREVTEDAAAAIGEIVGQSIARAFAKKEDQCGFIGDGSATYFNFTGIVKAVMALSGTPSYIMGVRVQATAGTWAAITLGDVLALPGMIDDDAEDEASPDDLRWYCHRNFFWTVMIPLAIAAGGTSAMEMLATAFGRQRTFAGYPVSFSKVFPRVKAAADHEPLMLANLRQCLLLGDARELTIETSREAYFTTDQIGIRGSERIALSPYNLGTLNTDTTPVQGAVALLEADIA